MFIALCWVFIWMFIDLLLDVHLILLGVFLCVGLKFGCGPLTKDVYGMVFVDYLDVYCFLYDVHRTFICYICFWMFLFGGRRSVVHCTGCLIKCSILDVFLALLGVHWIPSDPWDVHWISNAIAFHDGQCHRANCAAVGTAAWSW